MTAATVNNRYKEHLAEEVIIATVSDGETVTSSLSKPLVALATAQADDDGEINCTISGRTITVNAAGMTDVKIAILVKGRL
jgi:hypothetical protein